jgi:hypothetical protein
MNRIDEMHHLHVGQDTKCPAHIVMDDANIINQRSVNLQGMARKFVEFSRA